MIVTQAIRNNLVQRDVHHHKFAKAQHTAKQPYPIVLSSFSKAMITQLLGVFWRVLADLVPATHRTT
jgi:hypothetical protein